VTQWSKYFIMLFVTHAKIGYGRSRLDLYYHSKHVKGTMNSQLEKFTPLGLVSYVAVIYFGAGGGKRTTVGLMPLGLFLLFFWWSLAPDLQFSLGQTNTFCKRSVNKSIIFGRLAPIRQNLHERRCRKLREMQCNAISLTRARTKMLASFERQRFDGVTCTDQSLTNKVKCLKVKCKHILSVLLCFAKIFRESCVEKYKKFNGVDLSVTRARTKVLASF